ncbi:MAG TPA: hypothetical protein VH062_34420 [Polyangiaceae bacterium]|nr:hypothetical protein [Polyangiaceae bacterium]
MLPFDGDSVAEVCAHVLNASPAPLRSANPELDSGIEDIVACCLEKKPENRFASIAELAKALERYVAGAVSATRPASLTQSSLRTLAPPKRSSDPVASAALADEPITAIPGVRPSRAKSIAFALLVGVSVPLSAVVGIRLAEHAGYRPLAWTGAWLASHAAPADTKVAGAPQAAAPSDPGAAQAKAPDTNTAAAKPANHDDPAANAAPLPKWLLRTNAERDLGHSSRRVHAQVRAPLAVHAQKAEDELTPEEIVRRKLAYEEYLQQNNFQPIGEALQQMKPGGKTANPAAVPPPPPAAAELPPTPPPDVPPAQ